MRSLLRRAVLAYSIRNRRAKAQAISHFMWYWGATRLGIVGGVGCAFFANESVLERNVVGSADFVVGADLTSAEGLPWAQVVGSGCALPWRDNALDMVVSNAVIEHVGDEAAQRQFVAEHTRVANAWVITTPNRWFPIESHTTTVFRHWLPSWRASRTEFTRLLSLSEFRALLPPTADVQGHWWSPTFVAYSG